MLDLSAKVYLFRSNLFLMKTSISMVILFKMLIFNLLNFAFSNILSLKNSDWSISLLLMLALFAILGVSITFTCVDKLGVVSKGSNRFSEVSRILLDEDICMSGIISVIDMSVVSLFKKIKSLLLLILFVIFFRLMQFIYSVTKGVFGYMLKIYGSYNVIKYMFGISLLMLVFFLLDYM